MYRIGNSKWFLFGAGFFFGLILGLAALPAFAQQPAPPGFQPSAPPATNSYQKDRVPGTIVPRRPCELVCSPDVQAHPERAITMVSVYPPTIHPTADEKVRGKIYNALDNMKTRVPLGRCLAPDVLLKACHNEVTENMKLRRGPGGVLKTYLPKESYQAIFSTVEVVPSGLDLQCVAEILNEAKLVVKEKIDHVVLPIKWMIVNCQMPPSGGLGSRESIREKEEKRP